MSGEIPIIVQILDKDYRVACQEGEQNSLLASARFLDKKMREIRAGGRVIGTDRIAVITALNLAHELLEVQRERDQLGESFGRRIRVLREKEALIREELRTTTQRCNLFEKKLIPELKENIRKIKIFLGDQETAAVGRAKIAKVKTQERGVI